MPEIQFKGKEFVYNHHVSVPFRPLVPEAGKSLGDAKGALRLDGNLIIHGDNLHALKALMPMYAGKVNCIFIDPPYNTGNADIPISTSKHFMADLTYKTQPYRRRYIRSSCLPLLEFEWYRPWRPEWLVS